MAHLVADPSETPRDPGIQVVDQLEIARAAERVRAALQSMRPSYREVLMLAADESMSEHEIAQALGVPAGTVKSRLSRARAELRRRAGTSINQLGGE